MTFFHDTTMVLSVESFARTGTSEVNGTPTTVKASEYSM